MKVSNGTQRVLVAGATGYIGGFSTHETPAPAQTTTSQRYVHWAQRAGRQCGAWAAHRHRLRAHFGMPPPYVRRLTHAP
jgi:hypothetical protein